MVMDPRLKLTLLSVNLPPHEHVFNSLLCKRSTISLTRGVSKGGTTSQLVHVAVSRALSDNRLRVTIHEPKVLLYGYK